MADQEQTDNTENTSPKLESASGDTAAVTVSANTEPASSTPSSTPTPVLPPHPAAAHLPKPKSRRVLVGALVIAALAAVLYFGIPHVQRSLNTVSTDDAYVNGHVTFVAARVPGQVDVDGVLVDDNRRVKKGDVLVRLDAKPYEVLVEAKRAAYEVAKVNVVVAENDVHAQIGKARAARFKLQHAIEDVDNQVALLQANVAKLTRADADYKRALGLQKQPGLISAQAVDQYKETYRVALQQVYQTRVGLGLPEQPQKGELSDVPADLDQNISTVREALANLVQSAAPLGIIASSYDLTPRQLIDEFYKRDPSGNIDTIYKKIIADAPSIKFAEAKLLEAKADLDQAELNLSYCTVYAEIDGVVTARNVNPGNNVTAGQNLMAVRSLTEIWIDANFKETQLAQLRIGQPADVDVDMYGSHKVFKGRITGFTMGTGSTLALLPAENATGNFVKVVQRLPVRIELTDYDASILPLFIGLSVTPYVYFKEKPEGPNAGQFLQQLAGQAAQQNPPPVNGAPKTTGEQATQFPSNDTAVSSGVEKKQ